jgi:hypothetical protein
MIDSARCSRACRRGGKARRQRLERMREDAHAVAAPVRLLLEQAGALQGPLLERQLRGRAHLRLELLEERKRLDEQLGDARAPSGESDAKLRTGFSEVSITAVISALRLGK